MGHEFYGDETISRLRQLVKEAPMAKIDELKTLHRDLNQMANRAELLKTTVSDRFPDEAVEVNTKLDQVSAALEEAKHIVRGLAGVEAMKNGGSNP